MNIQLYSLEIENFKGIKRLETNFGGGDADISGQNAIGKTTVYDAFLWLLFDKDSTGRKVFDIGPLDKNNDPIPKLVNGVMATINFDGTIHTFKKERHENRTKKDQLRGYETLCWIDDVPKKVGEYNDYIKGLISEDTFKMLTDLRYFNEKINWPDRRAVLLDIAGKVGTATGFDELLAELKGRSIGEYKSVLVAEKKRLENERDEIGPRIDELQRGLDEYAESGDAEEDLQARRTALENQIKALDEQRQQLFDTENQRQAKIGKLNKLKADRLRREQKLSTLGLTAIHQEKAEIETGLEKKKQALRDAQAAVNEINFQLTQIKKEFEQKMDELETIRKRNKLLKETPIEQPPAVSSKTICPTCGQKLPPNKLAEIEQARQDEIAEKEKARKNELTALAVTGNRIKAECIELKKSFDELKAQREKQTDDAGKAQIEVKEVEDYKTERFEKLAQVEKDNRVNPNDDAEWKDLGQQIEALGKEIGSPAGEQLQSIETKRQSLQADIQKINTTLAQSDTRTKSQNRIGELKQQEKALSQQITDTEKELADIDAYNKRESEIIEAAVNDRFKYVTFKLFNLLLNGGIEPTCVALLDGRPYPEMSTGERIIVGVDIINVLSEHYGISVPLFVDNAESLTFPLESNSQTIRLAADPKVKKLKIDVQAEKAIA